MTKMVLNQSEFECSKFQKEKQECPNSQAKIANFVETCR